MGKRRAQNTKGLIVSAAWNLFYRQGYEDTTVEEIIEASHTSRGSFYHYFSGKDALLGTLSTLFDDKYQALMEQMDPEMDSFRVLMYLNQELFGMIEETVSVELLARMYSSQLVTKGEKHLMDRSRLYFRILKEVAVRGREEGRFRRDLMPSEIVKTYALCERALLYDWCLCGGEYSLREYGTRMMPLFMAHILDGENEK